MREIPWTAGFTMAQASAAGWTRAQVRHAHATGHIERLRHGVYLPAGMTDPAQRALAIAATFGGPPVCNRSALLVHGLPLVGPGPERPDVTVPPGSNANRPGLTVYRAGLREHDVVAGGTVTSVARTVMDVARHHPLLVSVPAIDAALHRSLTTPAEVEDVLEHCANWIWAGRARRAWALSDGRAESPLESISRLRLRQLKLPAPEPQKIILDDHGLFVGRVDFYWDEFGVYGEADGRGKYLDADGRWDDSVQWRQLDRSEALGSLGLEGARWTWDHAWSQPQVIRDRVHRAFRLAQARQRAGSARLWRFGTAA